LNGGTVRFLRESESHISNSRCGAPGVVVKAAKALSAKCGLGAGLSGGQESGTEGGGASGHGSPLDRNKKARRVGGLVDV